MRSLKIERSARK